MVQIEVVSQVWLSRFAVVAAVVYAYCAFRSLSLNPGGKSNRISFVLNLAFTAWAIGAVFWYSTQDRESAKLLYIVFSWTWCVFPPLLLHFILRLTHDPFLVDRKGRILRRTLLYAPSIAFAIVLPLFSIQDPVFRAGYWMLSVGQSPAYYLFVAHYAGYVLVACVLTYRAFRKSRIDSERRQLKALGLSMIVALPGGILTDTVFLLLGIEFPNLAIFWILVLSINILRAMIRYDLLASFPMSEAPRILKSLADFVAYFDAKGKLEWANESALRAFGVADPDKVWGTDISIVVRNGDLAGFWKAVGDGTTYNAASVPFGTAEIPVELTVHPVFERGRSKGAVLTAYDLSAEQARKLAEGKLVETGLLLEHFMRHSLDGILVTDQNGVVTRWNPSLETITGTSAADAIGRTIKEVYDGFVVQDDRSEYWKEVMKSDGSGANALTGTDGRAPPAWNQQSIEHVILRRDGGRRILQSSLFSIPGREGSMHALIVRDITEQRRLADEQIERIKRLDQAQKMDAVGTLTSGIAHDFNNTLAGIVGAISLIKMSLKEGVYRSPEDLKGELDIMSRAAERATSSVKRLLALTKKRPPENKPLRLDEIVKRVEEYLRPSLDACVSLSIEPMPEASIHGDSSQIEQLVLNLVINAEHSMTIMRRKDERQGGSIAIRLERARLDGETRAAHPEATDRDYFVLSVADCGVGIPQTLIHRIFEPFFTTKRALNATGLGLATVHSILRQHGGFIELRTEEGAGSTFMAYIPAEDGLERAEPEDSGIVRGEGYVIVADDDEIPRNSAVAMLKALGYGAEAYDSGEEALSRYLQDPSRWKAALLDYRMAGMRGDEAARAMREVTPLLPVIIATGYAPEEAIDGMGSKFVFLSKPYKVENLSAAISKALAKGREGA